MIMIGTSISESHTCRCVRSSISLYPNFGMFGMFGTGTSPLILPFDLADIAFDLTANSVCRRYRGVDAKLAARRVVS